MSSSSSSYVRIQLAPKAGFCIKTTTLAPAVLPPPPASLPKSKSDSAPPNPRLEPPAGPIPVPQGRKVFVNIAWDANVPPPPEGTEEDVRRAMEGTDYAADSEEGGWYVPVIVSNAREDVDKAGKPSLLFDCIYNTGVKARTLRDPEFKLFLIELGLQRIEAQTGVALSRTIATPNIASKGKLLPRAITVPSSLIQQRETKPPPSDTETAFANITPNASKSDAASKSQHAPLIQEIESTPAGSPTTPVPRSTKVPKSADTSLPGLRGILKKSVASPKGAAELDTSPEANVDPLVPLEWDWSKDDKGRLRIVIEISGLTAPLVQSAELDISLRRLELRVPHRAPLDIDVAPSDAEIISRVSGAYAGALAAVETRAHAARDAPRLRAERLESQRTAAGERMLRLKRQRDFDVDGAEAEWRIGEGEVVVFV